jgi:PAS domain S-box-containing protein
MPGQKDRSHALLSGLFKRQALVLLSLLAMGLGAAHTLGWTSSFLFDDAELINMAGRQRMLSQRTVAFAYQMALAQDTAERERLADELRRMTQRMADGHAHLVHRGGERGMSDALHGLYYGGQQPLDIEIGTFIDQARLLTSQTGNNPATAQQGLRDLARTASDILLPRLDRVVGQYQNESRDRVKRLQLYTEIAIYMLVAILAFSWLGVFMPMVRNLRREFHEHQTAQEQLSLILGTVEEGIIGTNQAGHVTFANRAASTLLGYPIEELEGRPMHSLVHHSHPDGQPYPVDDCPLNKTLEDGQARHSSQEWFWRKDVSGFPVHFSSMPIRKNGAMIGAVITFRDISAETATKRALAASEQVKSSILDAALDGIVSIDTTGRVVEFNPAAERIFGYKARETLGRDIADMIIPPQFRAQHRAGLARVASGLPTDITGKRMELTGMHADGHEIPLELTITHLPDHGLFTAFVRDVTDQRQTETALRRSQKLEAVGHLTGGIAHDFNNLLGIISGNLELLQNAVAGNEKSVRRTTAALRAAQRGAELTRRLLLFSRQDTSTETKAAVDTNTIIAGLHDMLQRTLTQRVEVRTRLSQNLWPVKIDRGEFEDALLNLAINARDAMPDGGVLTISTTTTTIDDTHSRSDPNLTPGEYVLVAVSDTGTGIDKENLERIFEPFFTTKERGKGTGLGLSMVYGFAKRSGGHVRVYSELGVGTTFRLYLPHAAEAEAVADHSNDETAPLPRGDETILVVDDEPHLVEIAADHLEELGYTVVRCSNPAEALILVEQSPHLDLVFTDVVMGHGVDGFKLARRIRETKPGCAVLLTSGFSGYAEPDGGLPDLPILAKPYSRTDLAHQIRQCLDNRDRAPS